MKKRYVNGTILCVEDYINSVNFECHDMEGSTNQVRTYRYLDSNLINIKYNPGTTIGKLPERMFERIESDDTELTVNGKIIPEQTVIINGIEYILSENTYDSISIYLLHNDPELGVSESRIGVYNNSIYVALIDSDYESWTLKDYLSFLNDSGYIFCHVIDKSKFKISNVYSAFFNNKIYEYWDKSIIGLQREFFVNDVTVTADFIRQIRERYPEIQFYARVEDRDSTKYNEWVNYKITPSQIKHGTLFTSHVWPSYTRGRVWRTGLDVEFEYATNDLPTLMARRDDFRVGGFFNRDQKFSYIIDSGEGEDFDLGYTVFWERDSLDTEYGKSTNQDDTGYSTFTYKYIGRLMYLNVEDGYIGKDGISGKLPPVVDHVIYTILYAPTNVNLKEYNDGVLLEDKDLDYRTFLEEFSKLSSVFEHKFGIHINYTPTYLEIDKYDNKESYLRLNKELGELAFNLKSIGDVATKESNYVMVASLKQVQTLVEKYRKSILEQIEGNKYDFGIEDGDIIGDDEFTMAIDQIQDNIKIEDIKVDEEDNDIQNSDHDSEDEKDPSDINNDNYHIHKENKITTNGDYIGKAPDNSGIIL